MGGWRGASGITDQTDEDWDFLERGAVTTLRNVTRVFYDDLAASDTGRFAMVTSTAVATPTAAGASYVAAKAAAEAWTLAVAEGFGTEPRSGSGEQQQRRGHLCRQRPRGPRNAREVPRTAASPAITDVADLAAAAVGLFTAPAAELNGQRLLLSR